MRRKAVLFLVLFSLQIVYNAARRPYVNDPECPRKPDLIKDRKCLKKCRNDADCKGRNKKCLCDDVCGKACVKPSRRCETIKPIFNGNFEIIPYNTFGARVRYTCKSGFILSGIPERICQGDGYWSLVAPTCETELAIEEIEGKCSRPPTMKNAYHDGPKDQNLYPLGTQLTYTCQSGYNIDGFFRAMCVGEGRWVGPRMTCSPRLCGHPGDISNGRRIGASFSYPSRVTYRCSEGYELVGRSYRICQASGDWSGSRPFCRPVTCKRIGAPANGNIHGSAHVYGSIVRFSCFRGFKLIGSQARRCQQDGAWSGDAARCTMVDCGLPSPFYNGYLDGQQTTYGATIFFRCLGRTTFEGITSTACLETGEWSHPTPKCWKRCEIPKISNATVHGFVEGTFVDHGKNITFICNPGYSIQSSDRSQCRNGTWTHLPLCTPAPCTIRPPEIRMGMVRYYSTRHGSKAKYRCETGYELKGDQFLTCKFGRWEGGEVPVCHPIFCPHPGNLQHGKIMLIGRVGKYEYRSYVPRIGHSERIEFQCSKGFIQEGATGATCVDGKWSPPAKPRCLPGQHPKLPFA